MDSPAVSDPASHDSGGCVPVTAVPEGVYGGDGAVLTVAADGSAELVGECFHAYVAEAAVAVEAVHWTLDFYWEEGSRVPDTAVEHVFVGTFDGTYCNGVLTGTLDPPLLGGDPRPFSVDSSVTGTVPECG